MDCEKVLVLRALPDTWLEKSESWLWSSEHEQSGACLCLKNVISCDTENLQCLEGSVLGLFTPWEWTRYGFSSPAFSAPSHCPEHYHSAERPAGTVVARHFQSVLALSLLIFQYQPSFST